jgi:RimJ/RimL family protein N-acetyltransferase
MGVATPGGTVVAVRDDMFAAARGARSVEELGTALGGRIAAAIFRWSDAPTQIDPLGEWRPVDDPVVPEWLHPFGGDVLVELDDDARYIAGVGLKRHDDDVWEISVGTEEAARGKGIARRLVTTAARAVIDAGRTPTYLHDPSNTASAKVAEASGFPERDWRMLFFVPPSVSARSTREG